jgi:AcrR family transcriptional regulator
MARRAPVQERSIASMNRMLDAGEQLFYEGGSPALTLEAVIERADTSTGSFYARFGDMRGFLDAMHERVLEALAAEFAALHDQTSKQADLETALQTLCVGGFDVVSRYRAQTYFFAVGNAQDAQWRAMGAQFNLGMTDAVIELMKGYMPASSSAAAKRRIDMAASMMVAAVFQQIMLDQNEISRLNLSQKATATELSAMLSAYLREIPPK